MPCHPTLFHIVSSYLILSYSFPPHLISSPLLSPHNVSSLFILPHLISCYLISFYLISSHPSIISHLIPWYLIYSSLLCSYLFVSLLHFYLFIPLSSLSSYHLIHLIISRLILSIPLSSSLIYSFLSMFCS